MGTVKSFDKTIGLAGTSVTPVMQSYCTSENCWMKFAVVSLQNSFSVQSMSQEG